MLPALLFMLWTLVQSGQFQISGEIVFTAMPESLQVELQSINHRFVDSTSADSNGKFTFKKIPEGMYELRISTLGGWEENRTIEVKAAFADGRGRISVRIDMESIAPQQDRLKA